MTTHVKVGSSWKDVEEIHVKVGTVWKPVENAYAKVGTTWKETYSAGPDWANMSIGTEIEGGMFAGIYNNEAIIFYINTGQEIIDTWQNSINTWAGLDYNGYSDWFLPSLDQSNIVATNIVALDAAGAGGSLSTTSVRFWTSTTNPNVSILAYQSVFKTPYYIYNGLKTSPCPSRGIRTIAI